jgi:serine/threonine protein kinase
MRYELGETIFVSGPSTFYMGRNPMLGNEVVVRRLAIDPERADDVRTTFFREMRHNAALRHPHIIKVLDVFEEDGFLWSVHPYVPSRPTSEIVEENGPLPLADAARIAAHTADALSYLHERGFVFGRLTPRFVLVAERGDTILTNFVKSADLAAGIWPLRDAVRGIGPFSAPEERAGEKPTEASDLFGLAAVFVYWVTGSVAGVEGVVRAYCESGDGSAEARQLAALVPQLPRVLAGALESALQPDPEKRRGSAAAFAALFAELHTRQAADVPSGFETGTRLLVKGFTEPVELTGRLGSGRYGVVMQARSTSCSKGLAVKVLKPEHRDDELVVERFLREARALLHIRHENVVRVHGVGEERGVPFLVMDFLDGPDLATYLRRSGCLEPHETASIAHGIASGLAAIHDEALLHRDLKPENVMIVGKQHPVITDLGVAKALREERLTMSGALVGTPLYMAPEQASGGEIGPATDLYALGAILYECLSGAPPHRAADLVALLYALQSAEPKPLPDDVPQPLARLTMQLLQKDPAQRPSDATRVAEELGGIASALAGASPA